MYDLPDPRNRSTAKKSRIIFFHFNWFHHENNKVFPKLCNLIRLIESIENDDYS